MQSLVQLLPHVGHALKDFPLGCVNELKQRLAGILLHKEQMEFASAVVHATAIKLAFPRRSAAQRMVLY